MTSVRSATSATTANDPVLLITGAARRIGATTARLFHSRGWRVLLHYHRSAEEAGALRDELNARRPDSCHSLCAGMSDIPALQAMAGSAANHWGRIDALINNASSFYPTPVGTATEQDWSALVDSNLKGPFFLSQALAAELVRQRGAVVNIADIYADQPLPQHTVYCIAKAGNVMMTRTLARELAPDVRVNGIAPGAILWPENPDDAALWIELLSRIPMGRLGEPRDIAEMAWFLVTGARYITGQVIAVDGGQSC